MQSTELEAIIRSKVEGVEKLVVSDVSGGCGQVSRGGGRSAQEAVRLMRTLAHTLTGIRRHHRQPGI